MLKKVPKPEAVSFSFLSNLSSRISHFSRENLMGTSQLFDLEYHVSFYGAYHSHPVNKYIHIYTVWPMFFGFLVFFYFIPPVYDLSDKLVFLSAGLCSHGLFLNFAFLFALIHALFFIRLDKKAGSLAALFCIACWIGACAVASRLDFSLAWKVVLAVQLFCFTIQAVGHGVWEKRAPSDNLVQAILVAPFCVFLEVLKTVFGYEPYPGFHASIQVKKEAEIEKWQAKQQKKMS